MTNNKKDVNPERILCFKLSQEFTEEALKAVSGAYTPQDIALTYCATYNEKGSDVLYD